MHYDIRIETIQGLHPTAVVRRLAGQRELSKVVPEACGIVWNTVRAQQLKGVGRNLALYLDCEINLEVGVELQTPFAGHGEVVGSVIPNGTVATTTHLGPYNQLHQAHQSIREWCSNQGYLLAGPQWEIYGHWEEAWNSDSSKIRTDVFYLLRILPE